MPTNVKDAEDKHIQITRSFMRNIFVRLVENLELLGQSVKFIQNK